MNRAASLLAFIVPLQACMFIPGAMGTQYRAGADVPEVDASLVPAQAGDGLGWYCYGTDSLSNDGHTRERRYDYCLRTQSQCIERAQLLASTPNLAGADHYARGTCDARAEAACFYVWAPPGGKEQLSCTVTVSDCQSRSASIRLEAGVPKKSHCAMRR